MKEIFLWVGGFDTDLTGRDLLNYFNRSTGAHIFEDPKGTSMGHAKILFRDKEHGMFNFTFFFIIQEKIISQV